MYFTLLYFTFFGMMTIAITPNHVVAPIIAAPFYTLWNLFSGFMIVHKVITNNFCSSNIIFLSFSIDLEIVFDL